MNPGMTFLILSHNKLWKKVNNPQPVAEGTQIFLGLSDTPIIKPL